MSIQGDAATTAVVMVMVEKIENLLEKHSDNPDVCSVLKELGRSMMGELTEWDTADWEAKYQKLFM